MIKRKIEKMIPNFKLGMDAVKDVWKPSLKIIKLVYVKFHNKWGRVKFLNLVVNYVDASVVTHRIRNKDKDKGRGKKINKREVIVLFSYYLGYSRSRSR